MIGIGEPEKVRRFSFVFQRAGGSGFQHVKILIGAYPAGMKHTLILFDIDGTLYHGDGSGRAAFGDTFREILGESFVDQQIDFAGRLDTWIFEELMKLNNQAVTPEIYQRFVDLAPANLKGRIESGDFNIRRCPGSLELVKRLLAIKDDEGLTLGLLTGNWPINGMIKVSSVGFEPDWFVVNAWGDDGPTRADLPPVALQRFRESAENGAVIDFGDIIIVGDTVHDVTCATANGCRSLAVATGWCSEEELAGAGADHVLSDLTDVEGVVRWMLTGQPS